MDDRHSWKGIHAGSCCPPRSYCTPPSSHISVTFPFISAFLSALLSPNNFPCNGHDPCGNGSTYSYRGCGVTNEGASAI